MAKRPIRVKWPPTSRPTLSPNKTEVRNRSEAQDSASQGSLGPVCELHRPRSPPNCGDDSPPFLATDPVVSAPQGQTPTTSVMQLRPPCTPNCPFGTPPLPHSPCSPTMGALL